MADKRSYQLATGTPDDSLILPADKSALAAAVGISISALKSYLTTYFATYFATGLPYLPAATVVTVPPGGVASFAHSTEGLTLLLDVAGSGANAALPALINVRTGSTLQCDLYDLFGCGLFLQRADGVTPNGSTGGFDIDNVLQPGSGKILVAAVTGAILVQNGLAQSRVITMRG